MDKEFLYLCLRNAIADKEWMLAQANRELNVWGNWRCDWGIGMGKANEQIQKILAEAEKEANGKGN